MTPPGWLVSVSDWPFKAAEAAVDLSNWLRTLQLPQLTRDCSQMCNKIQFGLVLCKDVPTLDQTDSLSCWRSQKSWIQLLTRWSIWGSVSPIKRSERYPRETWEKRCRFTALDKLMPDGRTGRHYDSLSSWRSQNEERFREAVKKQAQIYKFLQTAWTP